MSIDQTRMVELGLLPTKMIAFISVHEASDIKYICSVLNCNMEFLNQFWVSNLLKEFLFIYLLIYLFIYLLIINFVSLVHSMTVSV